MNTIPLVISLIAVAISIATFWLTKIHRGSIRMTRPSIICLVPKNGQDAPKIFIRTLLYCTSERGRYIQNMFVKLQCKDSAKTFSVWAYGDKGLVRGSGLFVDQNGIANYHHFLLPKTDYAYKFYPGDYVLQIFVEVVNRRPRKIFEQILNLTAFEPHQDTALYFDWEPDEQRYALHTDIGRNLPDLI
jgi:hypothetical protein